MNATPDSTLADSEQLIADLQRQLAERTAERDEALEYQTATSDVLKVISRSTADVQPVLDTVVETAARLCGADAASDLDTRGRGLPLCGEFVQLQRTPSIGRSCASEPLSPVATASPRGWRSKAGSCMSRTSAPTRTTRCPRLWRPGDAPSLGCRCCARASRLGTINLSRKRVEPFTERQIELVRTFADQAVIAMENARLLGELQARTRDLEESLEYQTATSDVLNVISRSTADVQPVLDTVVETAARLCGADTGSILIREGEVYRYVASQLAAADPEFWAALRQRTLVPGRDSVAGAGGARRQGRAYRGHPR